MVKINNLLTANSFILILFALVLSNCTQKEYTEFTKTATEDSNNFTTPFNKIKKGMTLIDVKSILGVPSKIRIVNGSRIVHYYTNKEDIIMYEKSYNNSVIINRDLKFIYTFHFKNNLLTYNSRVDGQGYLSLLKSLEINKQ
ncbi:MAG: hypothetical protein COA79_22370 [Planctomycetota bacterium]|nr:MAG: hypothetical protein COA79_22370 [Planctomycetota bacterium]